MVGVQASHMVWQWQRSLGAATGLCIWGGWHDVWSGSIWVQWIVSVMMSKQVSREDVSWDIRGVRSRYDLVPRLNKSLQSSQTIGHFLKSGSVGFKLYPIWSITDLVWLGCCSPLQPLSSSIHSCWGTDSRSHWAQVSSAFSKPLLNDIPVASASCTDMFLV